jgi:hypothetical protein
VRPRGLPGNLDALTGARVTAERRRRRLLEVLALLTVVAAAAVVRFYALDVNPGGLFPDEAAEGFDARRLLTIPGYHPVFFPDDAGREALYGYLVAIAFRLRGESVTVLRATSAVIGTLAVLAVYGWLRREGRVVALGAAAWVAGSLWLICISRDGMRNILVPATGAIALWGMSAWVDRPSRNRAVLAGALMALGLWTYQPLKLLPPLLGLWLLWIRRRDRERWNALRPDLAWIGLVYLVVGAPMLYTAVTQPALYFGRAAGVSIAGQHTGPWQLGEHTIRTLLMFAVTGDPNERHNVSGLPLLGWPLTLLALAGAWRAWRRRDRPLFSLLLVAVPVFLLPPLVATADAAPHFLRSLGLAAPLAGLVGLGCAEVLDMVQARTAAPAARFGAAAALGLLLTGLAAGSAAAYFNRPESHRYDAYAFNVVAMAGLANRPDDAVILDDYRAVDIRFLDGDHPPLILPRQALDPNQPVTATRFFALSQADIAAVLGRRRAGIATVVARGPDGQAAVWMYEGI